MKFIHLSDLHIGKKLLEQDLSDDQKDILDKILNVVEAEKPDGVIIAGDVYDRADPSAEAVRIFNDFLVELSAKNAQIFIISGNHDSADRIAFAAPIMDRSGVHMSPVYDGNVKAYEMNDDFGKLNVYMLPFVKPVHVRSAFPDETIDSYTDAMRVAVEKMNIDKSERNILITHQFVAGASRSDSELESVGGTDNVDAGVFADFDYVALGHLHAPQFCDDEKKIRYSGTPLKYSFSEAKDEKSVTIVEFSEKGNVNFRTTGLNPLHDLVEIKGKYEEITNKTYSSQYENCYVHITLTDEDDIPDVIGKLRLFYPHILKLDYDNKRTRNSQVIDGAVDVDKKSPLELLEEFYKLQNNSDMSDEQIAFAKGLIEKIWEDTI